MNQRTKQFIVAIQNHKIVYGNTNLKGFFDGMKAIEPRFKAKDTLQNDLEFNGFSIYISPSGLVYEIYLYENPNYKDA